MQTNLTILQIVVGNYSTAQVFSMKTKKDTSGAVFLRQKKSNRVKTVRKSIKNANFLMKLKILSIKALFSSQVLNSKNSKSSKLWSLSYSLVLLIALSSLGIFTYHQIVMAAGGESTDSAQPKTNTPSSSSTKSSPTEVIGQQGFVADLEVGGGSYSGEVVSKMDVNVYSPREGVIQSLSVNIGDKVWQGQSIGYLSVASEFDQIATTAEKKLDIDKARTSLEAINLQLNDVRNRLNGRKSSADAAKSAKISNANNAQSIGEITSQEKEERIKEAESDYSEVTTAADNEISALIREQKEVEKDFQAAEALSKAINGGVDRNIYAARAGIISGIFKNVGDYVTGEDQIAAVGIINPTAKDRCIRFKIPGNQPLPKVGEYVTITRPGIPFNKQQAKITGVGTALDDSGHFVVEAFFDEIVDWPVHAPVRVQSDSQTSKQILIPLSAVWFDNEGVTSVWIADNQNKLVAYNVKTGRAIGDRIEILEGLQQNDKIILQPKPDFKNGDSFSDVGISNTQGKEEEPQGDGHGHEHAE